MTIADWLGLWFPDNEDDDDVRGRRICKRCFVRNTCLEQSLDDSQNLVLPRGTRMTGIFAGIGSDARRHLLSVRAGHRYKPGCKCQYCEDVRVLRTPGRVLNKNTPNARCGYESTYSRGCRCVGCGVANKLYHLSRRSRIAERTKETG